MAAKLRTQYSSTLDFRATGSIKSRANSRRQSGNFGYFRMYLEMGKWTEVYRMHAQIDSLENLVAIAGMKERQANFACSYM